MSHTIIGCGSAESATKEKGYTLKELQYLANVDWKRVGTLLIALDPEILGPWGQKIKLDKGEVMDMGTLPVGRGCNTLTRTPGKQSNMLLGWLLELGGIDGSHYMKEMPKCHGRWQKAGPRTQRSRHTGVDILCKARKFLEYAASRAWVLTHWAKGKTPNIADTVGHRVQADLDALENGGVL